MPKTNGRKKAPVSAMCGLEGCCGGSCGSCACGGSAWKCHHRCPFMRWILGLIIIVFVFWCGMKIGELKSEIGGDSFSRHGFYDRSEMMGGQGRMMIYDIGSQTDQAQAVKADATKKK